MRQGCSVEWVHWRWVVNRCSYLTLSVVAFTFSSLTTALYAQYFLFFLIVPVLASSFLLWSIRNDCTCRTWLLLILPVADGLQVVGADCSHWFYVLLLALSPCAVLLLRWSGAAHTLPVLNASASVDVRPPVCFCHRFHSISLYDVPCPCTLPGFLGTNIVDCPLVALITAQIT